MLNEFKIKINNEIDNYFHRDYGMQNSFEF